MAVYFSVRTQYAHVRLLKISYRILGKQATATPLPPTGRGAALDSRGKRKQGTMRESTSPRRSRALVASTAVLLLCGGQHGVAEALTGPNAAGVGTPSASRMTAAASARGPSHRGVSAARMLSDANAENSSGNGRWKSRASPLFSSSGAAFAHRHAAALVGGRVSGARQPSDASATRLHAMVRPDIHTHPSIQVEHAVSFTREGWKHISGHVFPTYLFVQFLLILFVLLFAFCFFSPSPCPIWPCGSMSPSSPRP